MIEISYCKQSGVVRSAYRDGNYLVLEIGSSLPDVCVACGSPASGNVTHEHFGNTELWWALPTPIDVFYLIANWIIGKRYLFDFPFCPNCPPACFELKPTRLDKHLAVFAGASRRFLDLLPLMPPDVVAERNLNSLERKFRWLYED
jgi:hypothetical protein